MDFDLQGHRGARGLAPENTLAAFAEALRIGVTTLELDTAITRDGIVVVAHDRRLNPDITRGPDGRWLVAPTPCVHDLTLQELRSYDVGRIDPGSAYAARFPRQQGLDGVRMPRLADVFALARDSVMRFNIETKLSPLAPGETPPADAFADALIAVVRAAAMEERVTIQSFDWRTLLYVQQHAPRMHTSYLTAHEYGYENDTCAWTAGYRLSKCGTLPAMVRAAAGSASATWSPDARDLTPELVREARDLMLQVLPWTVNERPDMDRVIALGATGFITDYPDRGREALLAHGLTLPHAAR